MVLCCHFGCSADQEARVMLAKQSSRTDEISLVRAGLRTFHSLPCGFTRCHHAHTNRFRNLFGCHLHLRSHLRDAIRRSFARHGWYHRSYQFFSSILSRKIFCLSFFVIRIDRVNSPQFPIVVESCLVSVLPILVFSILSGFGHP